jgi:hypothetical protein
VLIEVGRDDIASKQQPRGTTMTKSFAERHGANILIIVLLVIATFIGVGLKLGIEGDDMFYISPAFRFYYENADRTYLWTVQLRQVLLTSYIFLYNLVGQSEAAMHGIFAGLWIASGLVCYAFLKKRFSSNAALLPSLLVLGYSGKYEVIGWTSAGLHIFVVLLFFAIGLIALSNKLNLLLKMAVITILYWLSLHFYEILLPLIPLPIIWLAYEVMKGKRRFAWVDALAVSLPIFATVAHIGILASNSKPIWLRSGGGSATDFIAAAPWTLANTLDALAGPRHIELLQTNWEVMRYLTVSQKDLAFGLGSLIIVLLLATLSFCLRDDGDKSSTRPRQTQYWIVLAIWLILIAPLVTIPVVMGMPFAPSRLTFLPSVGVAILLAVAIDRFDSRALRVISLTFIAAELLALHTILFQYASAAQYDADLRAKLKNLNLHFKAGDSLVLRLAPNDLIYQVWKTVPSKFESGAAQSILLVDHEELLFPDMNYPLHMRLAYNGVRSGQPDSAPATYVAQQLEDGTVCLVGDLGCPAL